MNHHLRPWFLFYWCCFLGSQVIAIPEPAGCGYDACDLGLKGMLNVHLIPHTHDDVGWLKTVDQYYYGSNNAIQRAGVQYILDSVVQALAADPRRRFTYVEMAYFARWWRAQTLETQDLVRRLVHSGRLQFALAGWSMADEATVHYTDAIDQLTRGHDFLRHLFGECGIPRVAWQIDPFGHSRDHTELFRDSGLDAVFFQRMDFREKDYRRDTQSLEVLWETSVSSNSSSLGLFTSMFYDSYCYPSSFCFDDKCTDEPMRDDPSLEGYNIPERVRQFLRYVNNIRKSFATNHIMVLMGCDFTYENANINFKNTDKLIRYVNEEQTKGSDVNLLYSTPQCYTKAVNEAFVRKQTIERRRGDFFPYASGPDSYWTGYYTSRPALKRFVRKASNLLAMTEQLHYFANRAQNSWKNSTTDDGLVDTLRRAMGVMQHHDAVTGTEKQHVARDYARILSDAVTASETLVVKSMVKLMPNLSNLTSGQWPSFCDQLNISICDVLEDRGPYKKWNGTNGVYVMLYNPTGWNLWNSWIRLPIYVPDGRPDRMDIRLLSMRSAKKEQLPYQLVPISERVKRIPERQVTRTKSNMELVFDAVSYGPPLVPAGFSSYYLSMTERKPYKSPLSLDVANMQPAKPSCAKLLNTSRSMSYELDISDHGSRPVTVIARHNSGATLRITMQMMYYYGETYGPQPSGAYVFLPKSKNISQTFPDPKVKTYSGDCVQEVHLEYSWWATLIVRLYSNQELETEWIVGPIPDERYQFSREVIIRYDVKGDGISPQESGEFFTDSAGRRLIRRVRNKRPDWNAKLEYVETQPVAGNYYPILSRIMLKGTRRASWNPSKRAIVDFPAMGFAVYTDRAQGGASLQDGQVELMVHRRLVRDDGYGVGEALTENGIDGKGLVVRGTHRIRLDELHVIEQEDQHLASRFARPVKIVISPAVRPPELHDSLEWSALNVAFPPHVHLLSLIAWPLMRSHADPSEKNQILLRLEHLGSAETFPPESIALTSMFRGIRIIAARKMTLTADQESEIAQARRLNWPTEPIPYSAYSSRAAWRTPKQQEVVVTLQPSTISTFLLEYRKESNVDF
ncbi:Alpha-mannosidase [Fasciola hepatica]|uniref:Alpha-mannosidase n=1 Tax=Fasciola hepatica TaxID=6192 RepID=A0A4E0RW88_FASHE|nr:Alpha-mannosidase [Fasciola hepatica]